MWSALINRIRPRQPAAETVQVGARVLPLLMVRHPRARRYLLRLLPNGTARVTIPRSGNHADALRFLERSRGWLETQLQRLDERSTRRREWRAGADVLFRGELVRIESLEVGGVRFGGKVFRMTNAGADLRPVIEKHLWQLAEAELPARVKELATAHAFTVQRVSVRNQRTRWGSYSRRGTISLNWRLIQTPDFVRDYIILHEMAHLSHMNHSDKFWWEVDRLCPVYREAERWLKLNRGVLR